MYTGTRSAADWRSPMAPRRIRIAPRRTSCSRQSVSASRPSGKIVTVQPHASARIAQAQARSEPRAVPSPTGNPPSNSRTHLRKPEPMLETSGCAMNVSHLQKGEWRGSARRRHNGNRCSKSQLERKGDFPAPVTRILPTWTETRQSGRKPMQFHRSRSAPGKSFEKIHGAGESTCP